MYEERYRQAINKTNRLTGILQGWIAYARELSEVRALQVHAIPSPIRLKTVPLFFSGHQE